MRVPRRQGSCSSEVSGARISRFCMVPDPVLMRHSWECTCSVTHHVLREDVALPQCSGSTSQAPKRQQKPARETPPHQQHTPCPFAQEGKVQAPWHASPAHEKGQPVEVKRSTHGGWACIGQTHRVAVPLLYRSLASGNMPHEHCMAKPQLCP